MKPKRHRWRYDGGANVHTCVSGADPWGAESSGKPCSGCGATVTNLELANAPFFHSLDGLWADKPLAAFVDLVKESKGAEDGRENHAED